MLATKKTLSRGLSGKVLITFNIAFETVYSSGFFWNFLTVQAVENDTNKPVNKDQLNPKLVGSVDPRGFAIISV